jgi:predicted amidohydrolase
VALADEAGRRGAKLIVLPEGTVPAYVLGTEAVETALLAQAAADLGALARRHAATVVCGGAKLAAGRTFNAAVAFGPDGREIGYAAKQFLWHFDRRWFAPGDTLEPLSTPLGAIGMLVCADGRIPTIAATLTDRGAQILAMPTAWVTSGRDPAALENAQADFMAGVRARENRVPFVAANKVGVELESVAYCGKSLLIEADGRVVARGSEREEEVVFGELTLRDPAQARPSGSVLPAPRDGGERRSRARIAFTAGRGEDDVRRFARLAAQADADLLLAPCAAPGESHALPLLALDGAQGDAILELAGVRLGACGSETFGAPRGLIAARLAGIDLFVWHASEADDPAWLVPIARTRAAELRAYVVVFAPGGRAFAVDPDAVVVAGTFEGYRLAAFAYDRARTAATLVAPSTDALEGLRVAEAIRERASAGTAVV